MRGVCSEFEGGNPSQMLHIQCLSVLVEEPGVSSNPSQMLLEMNQFGVVPGETPKPRNQMCDDDKET